MKFFILTLQIILSASLLSCNATKKEKGKAKRQQDVKLEEELVEVPGKKEVLVPKNVDNEVEVPLLSEDDLLKPNTLYQDIKLPRHWRYASVSPEFFDEAFHAVDNCGSILFDNNDCNKSLSKDHKLVLWGQEVIDRIWGKLSGQFNLESLPKPIIMVRKNNYPNGFVMGVEKCFDISYEDAKSRDGDFRLKPDKFSFYEFNYGYMSFKDSELRTATKCLESNNISELKEFIGTFNSYSKKCELKLIQNEDGYIVRGYGQCHRNNEQDRSYQVKTKTISFVAVANVINLNTGLFKLHEDDPKKINPIILHELVHYLRAHPSVGMHDHYKEWYHLDHNRNTMGLPSNNEQLKTLGQSVQTLGGFDWFHPDFYTTKLHPNLSQKIDVFARRLEGNSSYFKEEIEKVCVSLEKKIDENNNEKIVYGDKDSNCVKKCDAFKTSILKISLVDILKEYDKDSDDRPSKKDLALINEKQQLFLNCVKSFPSNKSKIAKEWKNKLPGYRDTKDFFSADRFNFVFNEGSGGLDFSDKEHIEVVNNGNEYLVNSFATFQSAMDKKLRNFTYEQEADELAIYLGEILGISADLLTKSMLDMYLKGGDQRFLPQAVMDVGLSKEKWPNMGSITSNRCEELYDDNWIKDDGKKANLVISDYTLLHHPSCYRIFRLDNFTTRFFSDNRSEQVKDTFFIDEDAYDEGLEQYEDSLPWKERYGFDLLFGN